MWIPVAVYLVLMPAMLWLGFWQLDRYDQRQDQLDSFAAAEALAPLGFDEISDAARQRFRAVTVNGRYLADRQILIDNIVRNSRNGFFVLSPIELVDGQVLLVNRGWIAQSPLREPLGDLAIDDAAVSVNGRVGQLPVGGLALGEQPTSVTEWPAILQYPTLEDVSTLLQRDVAPWVLLADADSPGNFERRWTPGGLPPERHLGYAVQWFAMCIALTLLMLFAAWRSARNRENDNN